MRRQTDWKWCSANTLPALPEWFGGIDPDAHVYYAYSDNPSTSRAFRDFKADKSEHLKLLFTIDMLSEGVHVEDVSGVILFCQTVSPIIYKQQIGRALSASKAKEPVIFDVVNNIENLYSIGTIEQEMRDALFLLQERGYGDEVMVDRFDVVDELRDCRELFARLDETFTVSWEMMFAYAQRYYNGHGDLLVPRRYRTVEGYALGNWIVTQRKVRSDSQYGKLDGHRIALLDSIGMRSERIRANSPGSGILKRCAATRRCTGILTSKTAMSMRMAWPLANVTKRREDGLHEDMESIFL